MKLSTTVMILTLWNALAVLVHENPEERFPLLHFFFDVATAVSQLNEIEYSFLFALGGHMGFSPEEVGSILIKRIGGGSFFGDAGSSNDPFHPWSPKRHFPASNLLNRSVSRILWCREKTPLLIRG